MIKALNEPEASNSGNSDESSNDEGQKGQVQMTREALEEQYFDKYRQALMAIQANKKDEAKDLLEELEDTLDGLGESGKSDETLMQLKFSVLRNLGNLVPNQVDHYVEALELDSTDISLWIKLGDRCMKLRNYPFARISYEQALAINANNWIAIERLIELYYILHLPLELYDICSRALRLNRHHRKASLMLDEAAQLLPPYFELKKSRRQPVPCSTSGDHAVLPPHHQQPGNAHRQTEAAPVVPNDNGCDNGALAPLRALKRKRQADIQADLQKFKRAKLGITLDTARTQSLASFGNYIIKIYERFSKQCITRNTMIDITISNTGASFSHQFNNSAAVAAAAAAVATATANAALHQNQSQNSSSEQQQPPSSQQQQPPQQTLTCSQDVEMVAVGDTTGASDSQNNDKATAGANQVEQTITTNTNTSTETTTNDNQDQASKSNNGGRARGSNHATQSSQSQSQSCTSHPPPAVTASASKSSSLSFAAMLFPQDLNDKRRSSRNRSNQDDTFSFKMKFDELNVLLPECLRIGAIEQALQKRREEQQQQLQQQQQQQENVNTSASQSKDGSESAPPAGLTAEDASSISVETNLDPVREDQIIKDVIEEISRGGQANLSSPGTTIGNVKLCDMFYVYLAKLAAKKQNSLPEAFIKIYKVYRRLCPLPTGVFIEINATTSSSGDGDSRRRRQGNAEGSIQLEELWFMLTANELAYQRQECAFMLRLLEQLQMYLDEGAHREFLVRLLLIVGMNSDYKYLELALQSIEEDVRIYASNRKIITRAHIKTLIDRQMEKLRREQPVAAAAADAAGGSNDNEEASAQATSENSLEIIERLAPKSENETSDREIQLLCQAITSAKLWQRGLNIINHRNDLNSDILQETINVCLREGAKMDAILASKLCKEAISGTRPTTWSCLYRGWLGVLPTTTSRADGDEDEDDSMDGATPRPVKCDKTVDNMDKFFELGHATLGKKGTCTVDKGEFLMLHVEHLLDDDDRDSFEERDLMGSTHCLFGYPSKRPAAVAAHKAARVPILWPYGQVLYHYLVPEELPTYMSLLRKAGITGEVEALLREIAESTPDELNPKRSVHFVENFIELGEPLTTDLTLEKNDVTQDLYYLLADYYFKNKDFKTAKLYYHYDLVINPNRFDSWAASGLIRASGIDKALAEGAISTRDFVQGFVRNLADAAIRCFEQATRLRPNEPKATLWIEFGNLTYNLLSLASRLYIYDDLTSRNARPSSNNNGTSSNGAAAATPPPPPAPPQIDVALEEALIDRHRKLYELAKKCFQSANELCHCDEMWLHYYMLGKCAEKVDPLEAIEFYHKADAQLYIEGASYPRKISYHNPPELAYEAMEVHYRIHAAALKFLATGRYDEGPGRHADQAVLGSLRRSLMNAQRSPFVLMVGCNDPKKSLDQYIGEETRLLLEDTIDSVVRRQASLEELTNMCLHGMKRCLVRCDKNFKALYRLAYHYRSTKRPHMAQRILMSREVFADERGERLAAQRPPGLPDFIASPPDLRGVDSLFKDRKLGNLFFGIWRMPIEEIDRPGCFEHWMFKCTWLLINTCVDVRDSNTLTTIAFQLSRQPETSKRYLQDRPRVILAETALREINRLTSHIDQPTG